jgi:phosphoribosylpyrophosphate synthetase
MIDALKRASAARITVVVPYYGYARQDRKDRPRVAISAKLIADLLTTAGANRALLSTCTPPRFRASSTFPSITSSPARCW